MRYDFASRSTARINEVRQVVPGHLWLEVGCLAADSPGRHSTGPPLGDKSEGSDPSLATRSRPCTSAPPLLAGRYPGAYRPEPRSWASKSRPFRCAPTTVSERVQRGRETYG